MGRRALHSYFGSIVGGIAGVSGGAIGAGGRGLGDLSQATSWLSQQESTRSVGHVSACVVPVMARTCRDHCCC